MLKMLLGPVANIAGNWVDGKVEETKAKAVAKVEKAKADAEVQKRVARGEVDWEASDGEIDADGNYTAPTVGQGDSVDVTITAYDKTYNADSYTPVKTEYTLTVNGVLEIEAEEGFDSEAPIPSGDTVAFTALGGDGNYTWTVAGPVAVELKNVRINHR